MSNETTRADNNAIILKLEVVGVVVIRIYGIEIISNLYIVVYSNSYCGLVQYVLEMSQINHNFDK